MASNNGRYKRKNRPPDYDGAIAWAYDRLRFELSPQLTYHNLWHTQQVVMPAAARLSRQMEMDEADIGLISVAVAYHDLGFIETYQGHEAMSMAIAMKALPTFGFSPAQIRQVIDMIQATCLPQKPRNSHEEVICDADLDILGREDFLEQNTALYQEVLAHGIQISPVNWLIGQVLFLGQHIFFTAAARQARDEQKQHNLAELKRRLEQMEE